MSTRAPVEPTWQEIVADTEDAFARGAIDRETWHARMAAINVPAYLAGEDARAQTGYTGDEAEWRQARGLVADALPRSGRFLDVGCAGGLLMESVQTWCAERGVSIEPYGLDIAPELVALARARLPHWAERIFQGNAASWRPGFGFDFVRTGLEYVPRCDRAELVAHLLEHVVAAGGRLLIGPYREERDETRGAPGQEDQLRSWGFAVAGRIERPYGRDERAIRRLVYVDRA